MTMKRMIALTICAVMLLAMIPTGILTAGADGTEGDWTTYRFANEYHDPGEDPWNQTVYKPEAGYQYTDEGFSTIADLALVAEVMAKHNYTNELIDKIFWKNFYDFSLKNL